VNQELFSGIIKSLCGSHPTVSKKATSITREEENIARYASGYVPYSYSLMLLLAHSDLSPPHSLTLIHVAPMVAVQ
jgi:hypothetical protein